MVRNGFRPSILWMDKILHHLRNPRRMISPVNTNQQWCPMVSKWCEMDFVHPQYENPCPEVRQIQLGHAMPFSSAGPPRQAQGFGPADPWGAGARGEGSDVCFRATLCGSIGRGYRCFVSVWLRKKGFNGSGTGGFCWY